MNDYYKLEESKKLIASIGDVGSTHKFMALPPIINKNVYCF